MTRQKTYRVPHRRRREQRTNYRKRLGLLRSRRPRFAVRKSLNNIVCQVIEYQPKGDRTKVTVSSADIRKFGWKGHGGNLPAAYLTGLLCGTMAKKKNISEAILDIGLHISTKGSGIYAALKGGLDAGLSIKCSDDILPSAERISGKHIAEYRKDTSIHKNFEETKKNIISGKPAAKKPTKKKPAKKHAPI